MAETLISPGVLARENDQSFVTSQPVERGAAIVGPTVLGPVERPTLISSFSSYQAIFGGALKSGSNEYTYLTSIAANQYFQNGGTSLLVTRVTSGSFEPASSIDIRNNIITTTSGLQGSIFAQLQPNQGSGSAAPATYTSVSLSGGGSGAEATVTTSNSNGILIKTTALAIVGSAPTTTADATTAAQAITTSAGSGATVTITSAGGVITTITVVAEGTLYVPGETVTITAATLTALTTLGTVTGDLTFTIGQANVLTEISAVQITTDGTGYTAGDTVTIAASDIGTPAIAPTFILIQANLETDKSFVLETISEGIVMNNTFPAGSDNASTESPGGTLASGSADNIRWQITSVNTSSGVFSIAIRRGNDTSNRPVVLEQYNNINLDPFSPNYISRAIGDLTSNVVTEGADTFLQESGSFRNISSYVRVKSVNAPTPNYFNNDGSAKNEFTSSLPQLGSGSFDGAVGSNIPAGRAANFYQYISNLDSQGLIGDDYNTAIALLANQDDYQYNVISVPGLYQRGHATQITSVMNNSIQRGDNIAVIDLVEYNQNLSEVVN